MIHAAATARFIGIVLCVSSLLRSPSSLADSARPTLNLTGTFNDWRPDDPAFVLSPTGNDRHRIKKFFRAGRYQFKFAVNGGWANHYGAGDGNAVSQPGGDITLDIPRHGAYFIDLDLRGKRWTLVPTTVEQPTPVVLILNPVEVNLAITLDASESVAREDAKVTRFEFGQDANDALRAQLRHDDPVSPHATVILPKEGIYRLWAKVNDGIESAPEPVELHARTSYQVLGDWTGNDPSFPSTFLPHRSGFVFERIFKSTQPARRKLTLVRNHDKTQVVDTLDTRITSTNTTFWRVRFDEKRNHFTCLPDDFVELTYRPADDPALRARGVVVHGVAVAGSFNGWSATATPMADDGKGTYGAFVKLGEGLHTYKFVVNGSIWLQDPKADPALRVPDGHEGFNSAIFIGERGIQFGPPLDNDVRMAAVRHDPTRVRYLNVVSDDRVEVALRTLQADATQASWHVIEEQPFPWSLFMSDRERIFPLQVARSEHGFDYWKTSVFLDKPAKRLRYFFTVVDSPQVRRYGKEPDRRGLPKPFAAEMTPLFPTPDWARHATWYQVFPDRFRNGTIANDPTNTVPWRWDWYKCTAWETPIEGKKFSNDWYGRRFGGDLQGMIEKLPYFRELGVTAIYLCPIFEAHSYHAYDTTDYRHVSRWLGFKDDNADVIARETLDPATWEWTPSDKLFLEFVTKAHAHGLKVIVDGVFNHMGKAAFALQDVVAHGEKSPYADWFDVTDWGPPVRYKSWDGGGWMPNFRKDDEHGIASDTARQYLYDITRRWMDPNGDGDPSEGIDGWRLDVAPDVPSAFWIGWRKQVKSINPDAYITGEEWGPAVKFLQGDQWDAVMNYQFAIRAVRFFIDKQRKISASEFGRQLQELLAMYPTQVNLVMQNLYDSHDTDRLVNMVINPDRDYDQHNRPQDGKPYDGSKPDADAYRMLKLMTTFQMTFVGAPMIWYGNEVGMYGADDPTNRKPMLWKDLQPYDNPADAVMDDVQAHFRRLVAIRNTYPALRTGTFQALLADDARDLFAFVRARGEDKVVVVINNSPRDQLVACQVAHPNGARVVDVLNATGVELHDRPAASLGFAGFARGATVKAVRLGAQTSPVYEVIDGKVSIRMAPRSGAILVPR